MADISEIAKMLLGTYGVGNAPNMNGPGAELYDPQLMANRAIRGWGGDPIKAQAQLMNSAQDSNTPEWLRQRYIAAARMVPVNPSPGAGPAAPTAPSVAPMTGMVPRGKYPTWQ